MAENKDIGLKNNDLVCRGGDFIITASDSQHVTDTINAFPGWWKEDPADGVGLFQYMGSAGKEQELKRAMQINLSSDGYTVNQSDINIDLATNTLTVNPNAVNDNV